MVRNSISGFEDFAEEFEAAAEELRDVDIDRRLGDAVEDTAQSVADSARRNAPVDTGELRNSIHVDRRGRLAYWVVADADHATAVEYGHGGHTITPDEADALRFEIDGEIIYSQSAEIPPRPPNPFLRSALMEHRSTLRRNIRNELQAIWTEALTAG